MSVVGIDFGNSQCRVAVARRGGIEVLQNEVSKRNTPCIVAYHGNQRSFGDHALAGYSSNIKNTVTNVKRYLGKKIDEADTKAEPAIPVVTTAGVDGRVAFEVSYDEKKRALTAEQVTAAMLQRLKQTAEAGLDGQRVVDCVIGCPPWWTDVQRRALLDSANIAGLNVLRLMNETTAVALNYGIVRTMPEKEVKVLFIDLGHASYSVDLVSFASHKLKVIATASDPHLGGRTFDQLLIDHFAAYIKTKYQMDVTTNAKAYFKLAKECERVKSILSANTIVNFGVEYIMDDRDVSGRIERSEFEAMAQVLLPRFVAPIEEVLRLGGITKDELTSIEIVGGATRIPVVQNLLATYFGRDLSKTCDSDESVARGCALMCAMLSPSFKVREFDVADVTNYPIDVQWGDVRDNNSSDAEFENTTQLFTAFNPIPSVKMISFKDKVKPFELVAKYAPTANLPVGTSTTLGRYVISGMPTPPQGEKAGKIKVRIKLTPNGTLAVTSAQLLEEVPEPVAATPAAEKDGAAPMETEEAAPANATDMDTSDAKASATPAAAPKKVTRVDIAVESFPVGGLDSKSLTAFVEVENSMNNQDRVIKETIDARNLLESYVLTMRGRISDSDDLQKYYPDADREAFDNQLREMELWLEDCGFDIQKSEYKTKLAALHALGDKGTNRLWEASNREEAIGNVKSAIGKWSGVAASKEEKYAHITPDERKKVVEETEAAEKWLNDVCQKQHALKPNQDPAVTVQQLADKKKALETASALIMNRSKPIPPKEDKKVAEAKAAKEKADKAAADAKAAADKAAASFGTDAEKPAATETPAVDAAASTNATPDADVPMDTSA